ncbi:hypothetical protein BD769DRAFT_1617073 [Suillus cothurnatus]|nr:hypothetical protein BD769DRAFT_1617073 [Suillus cothurnatus]
MTSLRGAQLLLNTLSNSGLGSASVSESGLLNFGDATSPGRGFLINHCSFIYTLLSLMKDTAW